MSGPVAYRVFVGEHEFDVTIEAIDDGLLVQVGDERHVVAWRQRGGAAGTLALGNTTLQALVAAAGEAYWVAVEGYHEQARVVEARALRLAAALPRRSSGLSRVEIRAPMPGRVTAIGVAPGTVVERGTPLAILEAMKMENELRAPQPGRVAEVRVREGETVEHGALLLVLEPPKEAPTAEEDQDGAAAGERPPVPPG